MSEATRRRPVHTRSIAVEAFAREDGLWDLEASLVDTKAGDFQLAAGIRPAGEPVHDMHLTVTIDTQMTIVSAGAQSKRVPYPSYCEAIEPAYQKLVGLNLRQDFRRAVRERLGGMAGCSHLTELTAVLPTVAVQAFAGEVYKTHDSGQHAPGDEKPWQLDRCHALRSDGEAVAQFYPRWHVPTHTGAKAS